MSLKADILAVAEEYDRFDGQDIEDVKLVMVDCQECEYHDSFESVEAAELYIRGHALVSRHYDIDIGVDFQLALRDIDMTISVGDTIESS